MVIPRVKAGQNLLSSLPFESLKIRLFGYLIYANFFIGLKYRKKWTTA